MTDEHLTLAKIVEVADPRHPAGAVILYGVAVLEGYGRRIVDVEPGPGGSMVMTGSRNCVHGRPIRGKLVSPAEWVGICRACEFELDRVAAGDSPGDCHEDRRMMTVGEDQDVCAACGHEITDHLMESWDCLVDGCGCHVVMDE